MSENPVDRATAPARWLLDAGVEGVALTQTHALSRAVVREAVELWPGWWDAELFGPPHREADVRVLQELRAGLRRLGLVRRRSRRLFSTVRGRELSRNPATLLELLADDLAGGDAFTEVVAAAVIDSLASGERCSHDDLATASARRARRAGWRDEDDRPPTHDGISWVLGEVLCRAEAYGLIERHPDPAGPKWRHLMALSDGGRQVLGSARASSVGATVFVFDAELVNAPGVSARLAVGADQHLTALHDAIRDAFGWYDEHLYSFWLDGRFWGDEKQEFTTPEVPDEGRATADLPIAELDLALGARVAYLFDFGDEWRVRLTPSEHRPPDAGSYPRVLEREGNPPPQYGAPDEA